MGEEAHVDGDDGEHHETKYHNRNDSNDEDENIIVGEEYVIDKNRRSSVDIASMTQSSQQQLADSDWDSDHSGVGLGSNSHFGSTTATTSAFETNHKRPRSSRELSVTSIREVENEDDDDDDDDEEIE